MSVIEVESAAIVQSSLLMLIVSLLTVVVAGAVCVSGCHYKRRSMRRRNYKSNQNGVCVESAEMELNGDVSNGRPLSHDRALPDIPATASGVASTDDDEVDEGESHYDVIPKSLRLVPSTSRDARPLPAAAAVSTTGQLKKGNHPYEIVGGDLDSDSMLYDLGGQPQRTITTGIPLGLSVADPAVVIDPLYDGIGEDGCSMDSLPVATTSTALPAVYSSVGCRSSSQPAVEHSTLSMIGSGEVEPVVPDRRYDAVELPVEIGLQLADSPLLPPRNADLNGRTFDTSSSTRSHATSISSTSLLWNTPAAAAAAATATVIGPDAVNVDAASASTQQPAAAEAVKRVPNYSSVTARESLETLRRRQQLEQQQQQQQQRGRRALSCIQSGVQSGSRHCSAAAVAATLPFIDVDGTYDTIDYDLIKLPVNENAAGSQLPVNTDTGVYNNGSDLYAEISTGGSSAHSSTTYARVSDLPVVTTGPLSPSATTSSHAPVPPSVDTLQQLTHFASDDTDSIVDPGYSRVDRPKPADSATGYSHDPGYSRIDRPRPYSVHTSTESQPLMSVVSGVTSGRRSPVYAVVSKSSRRQNADSAGDAGAARGNHVGSAGDIGAVRSNSAALASNSVVQEPANAYAQVSKPNRHRRAMSHDAVTVEATPLDTRLFGISRPRWESDSMRNTSGYATIDGATDNDIHMLQEADYDTVGEPLSVDSEAAMLDFDPNYETVLVPPVTQRLAGNTAVMQQSFGVAREIPDSFGHTSDIMLNGNVRSSEHSLQDSPPDWVRPRPSQSNTVSGQPLIREHIYQEVTSSGSRRGTSAQGRSTSSRDSHNTNLLTTDL